MSLDTKIKSKAKNARNLKKGRQQTPEVLPAESGDIEIKKKSSPGAESTLPATSERAISPSDPLKKFLDEIKRYPLLSAEEEKSLVDKMRDGDVDAAKTLVTSNLRLVVKIAFEYRTIYSNMLDLIQEGNIGLMKAVSKYEPEKGARLGYYASWWIRSYILKFLIDNFRLVKIGTTQAQKKLFYHLMKEKSKLEAQGIEAAPKLLADRLDVKESEVVEMQQRLSGGAGEISLDAKVGQDADSNATYVDLIEDDDTPVDEVVAKEQLLQMLKSNLPEFKEGLSDKESRVLEERILSEVPKTLQEVADVYGLTRERVRQIESKVIQKLRDHLKNDFFGQE